jgi:hypothetical protein
MLAFSDDQLQIVMAAAGSLPVEKRSTFLECIAGRLRLRGTDFTDKDLDDAVRSALTGLMPREPAVRRRSVPLPVQR